MEHFSDFSNLKHYLDVRCQQKGITLSELTGQLHWPANYMDGICQGLFKPSRPRAVKLAQFFGDDELLVLVVSGLETPPFCPQDQDAAAMIDLYRPLPEEKKRQAQQYLRWLAVQPCA